MKQRWFILLLYIYSSASSQTITDYSFRYIDQSRGLLNNNIHSIAQDRRGFMWIGTDNGLQRYDGVKFVNYQSEINWNNNSINIADIYPRNNDIWFICNFQLGKFDFLKNTFQKVNDESLLGDTSYDYDTYKGNDSQSWKVNSFIINKYDRARSKASLYINDVPTKYQNKRIIVDYEKKQTWVSSGDGLILFDMITKKAYDKDHNPFHHPLLELSAKIGLSQVMIDRKHNIWVFTGSAEFYRYNPDTKKLVKYSIYGPKGSSKQVNNFNNYFVDCIFQDSHNAIWLGSENAGLLRYSEAKDKFFPVTSTMQSNSGIQYNHTIYCIFEDREENIWVGTDKGITIFNPYHNYFKSIRLLKSANASLPYNEINGIIEAEDQSLMIGTWGSGFAAYDKQSKFTSTFYLKGNYEKNYIWCFIKTDNEKIWIGCQHGYIHIYESVGKKIITIHPPQLNNSTIRCMRKDKHGNIWFGLHNGEIAEWEKKSNTFISFKATLGVSLLSAPVFNIFIDRSENIWVCTNDGFKQFDPTQRMYSAVYLPDKLTKTSISSHATRGIDELNDSTLVIGTVNGGLVFFNTRTRNFSNLSTKEGMPGNNILAVKKDKLGDIWFTTDYNLFKYNNQLKTVTSYNFNTGIINSSFSDNNFIISKNGSWLTTTGTEVISFYPYNLKEENHTKDVTITGFKIADKEMFIDSLLFQQKPIILNYRQNFVKIEFAALNFTNLQQPKYYYQLKGVDKDWVIADHNAFATYTNLDPGTYSFSVRTEDGDLHPGITSFSIIITPPVWKTWWFTSLIILAAVLCIYLLVVKRIKTIRHESELKRKIIETEMQALRAQMNPHFIFNCLNSIDNLIQTNQKDKATTYLAKFAKLIRVVLDSSKNNVIPFYKDYEALKLFLQLEQFRSSNKFEYELKADDELLLGDYKVPPLLVQPFIENAIHHGLMNKIGKDKKLSVHVTIDSNAIKYIITDNGVGRKKALDLKLLNKPEHVSYGIQISTERIHLYNRSTYPENIIITDLYNDGMPAGTKVEINILINKQN